MFTNHCSKCSFLAIIISLLLFTSSIGIAQQVDSLQQTQNNLLRVFLDCGGCNFSIIQNEVPFINYVRDPAQAQIHVLVNWQNTGSGGRLYNFEFIGREEFRRKNQTLTFTSLQTDTDIKRQEGIAKVLMMGLMPYVSQTNLADQIKIVYDGKKVNNILQETIDPWDNWVFSIDLRGGYDAEENNNSFELENWISGNRVTEDWRFRNSFQYEFEEENFSDNGETIKSTRKSLYGAASVVKSFSTHWSAGMFGEVRASTYENIRLNPSLYPGIEYNFFQWSDYSRKILTLGYYLGYKNFDYIDKTIYNKLNEDLIFHSIRLEADLKQPWGNFWGIFGFSHYLQLDKKYNMRFEAYLALRVAEGLSFTLGVEAESIHDQLYLPSGDASLEEILLKQRQLQTTYNFESSVGLRYTFGSIYNNVVNIRM